MAGSKATEKEPLLPRHRRGEEGLSSDMSAANLYSLLDRPVPATANPVASLTHRRPEYRNELSHHPDRGAGFYEYSRARYTRASLVETGR